MVGVAGGVNFGETSGSGVAIEVPQVKQRGKKRALLVCAVVSLFSAAALLLGLQSYTARTPVLVANSDIERGQVLSKSDFKVVEVAGARSLNSVGSPSELIGKVATTSLSEGDLFSDSVISDSIGLEDGQSVTGLVVGPGQYPTRDLKPGDTVDVLAAGSPENGGGERLASGVRIYAVLQPDEVGSKTDLLVSLVLDDDQATAVAAQVEQPGGVRLTLRSGQ